MVIHTIVCNVCISILRSRNQFESSWPVYIITKRSAYGLSKILIELQYAVDNACQGRATREHPEMLQHNPLLNCRFLRTHGLRSRAIHLATVLAGRLRQIPDWCNTRWASTHHSSNDHYQQWHSDPNVLRIRLSNVSVQSDVVSDVSTAVSQEHVGVYD